MRLLLDEHCSPEIARQLRRRRRDVVSVSERDDLVGLSDEELLRRATAEGRALLTNDVDDFTVVLTRLATVGEGHFGVLFTSDRRMPRTRESIGMFVRVLGEFLRENPSEDAFRNRVRWLP